jgi:hypothetical protein
VVVVVVGGAVVGGAVVGRTVAVVVVTVGEVADEVLAGGAVPSTAPSSEVSPAEHPVRATATPVKNTRVRNLMNGSPQ